MIVLQFGMQGSASSWLFNTLVEISNTLGHDQQKIVKQATGSTIPWRKLSGEKMGKIEAGYVPFDLNDIDLNIDRDEFLVLKTHSDRPDSILELLLENKLKVFVSTRDPIDAAWSIYNKSKLARSSGKKEFSHIKSIEHALNIIRGDCLKANTWRYFKNVFFYDFEEIRNNPKQVIESICGHLEIDQKFKDENSELQAGNFNKGLANEGYKNISREQIEDFYSSIKSI